MAAADVKLPDGWQLMHSAEPQALKADGAGTSTITVKDGSYIAGKRVDGMLVEQAGATPEALNDAIAAWEQVQPAPNPATEDGNRVLTDDEKLESATATAHMQITQGAKVGLYVDLTPEPDPSDAKGAYVSASPPVETEQVSGDQAQPMIVPGPKSTMSGSKSAAK